MKSTQKIALFAHRLDGLFFKSVPAGISLYYLVPKTHLWLRNILKGKQVIIFDTTKKLSLEDVADDDIIKHSNVTKVLREKRIDGFVTSHRGSAFLKRWAKEQRISLIGTDPDDQLFYENKVQFDRLLKKMKIPSPQSSEVRGAQKVFPYPFVVQEPSSFGSFGTYIIHDAKTWLKLKSKLLSQKIYLARRFIKGIPLGITIYIDDFRIALSAIRQQCFFEGSNIFAGVQWRKSGDFKKKTIEQLNRTLLHLAMTLQDRGFFGFANIDFILESSGDISILECNPRLSSASPHLFGVTQTFSGLPLSEMFLSMGQIIDPPPFFFFPIPNSTYEGSLLDVLYLGEERKKLKQFLTGTYRSDLKFVSPQLPNLGAKGELLLYYAHTELQPRISPGSQIATVISNFPLFSSRGTLNRQGQLVHSYFTDEFTR